MPTCLKHGEYYDPESLGTRSRFCHQCNQEVIAAVKASAKEKRKEYRHKLKQSPRAIERSNLKSRLQVHWRKKIFPFYESLGLTTKCWINPHHRFIPGLNHIMAVPHVSHYFPKSDYYFLWLVGPNSGICCYDCNVNKPQVVAAMEPALIDVWGVVRVQEVKEAARVGMELINTGRARKNPSDQWFLDSIRYLKTLEVSLQMEVEIKISKL